MTGLGAETETEAGAEAGAVDEVEATQKGSYCGCWMLVSHGHACACALVCPYASLCPEFILLSICSHSITCAFTLQDPVVDAAFWC